MAITAQDVNKLRRQTGAGMMDCKKALVEAEGNFDKAIDILRKKGQKISLARADRTTTEGTIFVKTHVKNDFGVILALGCETDFVAKNEAFQNLGNIIIGAAFENNSTDIEAIPQLKVGDLTINEKMIEVMGKIGEKIEISAYETLRSDIVVPYVHTGNKLGVLIGLQGKQNPAVLKAGKEVAMQIAAMNPLAIDKEDVDASTVEREIEIAKAQARAEGKPKEILEKIAQGKLSNFFKENTLLNQSFIKDNSLTVAKYLQDISPNLAVCAFKRIAIGA